ncbi:MAG: DUF4179 domain-containing protein [Lachnospira sp.]|nr:DUF4179 domain-containing protein [Lachnospira sp.]
MLNHKDYKNALDSISLSHISDDAIYSMESNSTTFKKSKGLQVTFNTVAAVAVAIIGLSCVTVSAYDVFNRYNQPNKNAGKTHEYAEGETDKSIDLNITKNDNNVNITVDNVKIDSTNMYITIDVATTDGSALMSTSVLNVASLINNQFESAYLTTGSDKYYITETTRVDDCKDATSATYELHYMADAGNSSNPKLTAFKGSDIMLVLKNLTYPLVNNADIGFTQTNLASILAQSSSGNAVTFSKTYPNASIVKVEKTQHIADDAIASCPAIAITYKADSESTLLNIINLKLFNKTTGVSTWPISDLKGENHEVRETLYTVDDNGYITVTYTTGKDENLHDNLSNYILTGDSVTTTEVVSGEWSFKIPVDNIADELVYTPNVSIEVQGTSINIHKVVLTDSNLQFYGKETSGIFDSDSGHDGTITLVMNDGSKIVQSNNSSRSYDSNTRTFDCDCTFEKLVNSEDVVGFYFNNQYLKLK